MAQKWIDKIEKNNEEYDIYREGFEIGTNESGNYTLSLSNTPPIYNITDQVPYNFRPSGGDLNIGKKELDELVGGTIAWNQLVQNGNFASLTVWNRNRCDLSVADNIGTFTCNDTTYSSFGFYQHANGVVGHKLLVMASMKPSATNPPTSLSIQSAGSVIGNMVGNRTKTNPLNGTWYNLSFIGIVNDTRATLAASLYQASASDVTIGDTIEVKNFVSFDLTQMFGTTIADYVYSLEQANAGAGVAFFRKLFPRPYYAYNDGELISVKTSAHKMVGFNQFNISSKTNNSLIVWATGNIGTENMSIVSDYIRIVPRAKYYCNYKAQWCCYDNNYTYLGAIDPTGMLVFSAGVETNSVTLPTDYSIVFIRLGIRTGSNNNKDMTAKTDINLNLSYNGSNDGEYEPYQEHTYNLPNVELRGIFKLDSNNKLYCDGDIEKSDGTITRKYGIVDLGTLTSWGYSTVYGYFGATLTGKASSGNFICQRYLNIGAKTPIEMLSANDMTISYENNVIRIKDASYTDAAAFKAAMSGVYLVYELETPTTEKTNFFTNPQTVYNQGTEEYIDNREVAIPVGHNTKYDEPWEEIKN